MLLVRCVHRPRPQADGGRSQGSVSRAGRSLNKTAFDASLGPKGLRQGARFSDHLDTARPSFATPAHLAWRGIVSKRRDARDRSGRSLTRLKIKNPSYER